MAGAGDPNFGERMKRWRAERGLARTGGQPKLVERHSGETRAVESTFARAMKAEAEKYVRELDVKEPERCPEHNNVLQCPDCDFHSQRTYYNHKAAQYVFDRIMGKPTTRSEVAITIRLVEQITAAFVLVFGEINGIPDADDRRTAFAARCRELGAHFGGDALGT